MHWFRRFLNAGLLRQEREGILAQVRATGVRGGVTIKFRDPATATSEQERVKMLELNDITRTAISQLLCDELAGRYELNDHGTSVSLVPKLVSDRTVRKEIHDDFVGKGTIYDAARMHQMGYKAGELPDHVFRNFNAEEFNGKPGEDPWAEYEAKKAARHAARTPKTAKPNIDPAQALVGADGQPLVKPAEDA